MYLVISKQLSDKNKFHYTQLNLLFVLFIKVVLEKTCESWFSQSGFSPHV